MKPLLNVFKRETAAYFNAAIGYIFIIVFVLLSTGLFMTHFFIVGVADMRYFFTLLPFVLSVFIPAVTMRLWAEEKRGNTLELLLTFPMQTQSVVLGKFLASLVFYLAALAGTLMVPVMLFVLGKPDPGQILGGYLGSILLGGFFLSIGIFISGFCRDQIVAFILTMMACFGIQLIGTEFIAATIDGWLPGFGSFLQQILGSAGHFDSFAKGVFDNRDVLYFAIGSALFLVLNGYWLEGRMKPGSRKMFAAAAAVCFGIFLTGNWFLSGVSLGRFDLTEGRMYTISDSSKTIFQNLKAPVTAKLYISPADKMPTGMKTLEQDVLDKLEEMRVASKGRFQYKVFHMEAANVAEKKDPAKEQNETLEEELQKKGIQPFQVQAIESDEMAVRLVYASMTLAYKEKPEEIIPQIIPDNVHELEYMVVSKVFRMTLPEAPRVTLVAPYQESEMDPQMAGLLKQMGGNVPHNIRDDQYELLERALRYEGYEVARLKELGKDSPIPSGTKTLILMEPSNLNDRQRYEINRFLHEGGSLFLGVQNYFYNYQMGGSELRIAPEKRDPQINTLLSEWGFEVDEYILVDEQHDVINISGGARMGPFELSIPVKLPIQILVTGEGMNPDLSVTSRLSPVFYLWGTAVKVFDETVKKHGLQVQKLLSSSKASWTVPAQEQVLSPGNLLKQPESRLGPFPLAVLAQGQFPDVWKDREVPAWSEGSEEKLGHSALKAAPGKMILTGAAIPFQKNLLRGGGHLNFFMNSIDALTLGDQLITIRSKQAVDRTIRRVSAPSKIMWRVLVSFLIPIALAVLGFMRSMMRRRAKQQYLKDYSLSV